MSRCASAQPQSPSFEYLTPADSSHDYGYQTTPEIADLVWQENFVTGDESLDLVDPLVISDSHGNTENRLQTTSTGTFPSHPRLPSPQLTASPAPAGSSLHSQKSSLSSLQFEGSNMSDTNSRTVFPTMGTDPQPSNISPSRSRGVTSQPISPVIHISSHSRGDSPARDQTQLTRNTSKRSNSSKLSGRQTTSSSMDVEAPSLLMPPTSPDDDDWEDGATERAGVDPTQRNAEIIPSLKDMEEQEKMNQRLVGVQTWLANTNIHDLTPDEILELTERHRPRKDRLRSRSTGTQLVKDETGLPVFGDSHIPGPNAVLDVDDKDDYSDQSSDVPTEYDERPDRPETEIPPEVADDEIPPEQQEPAQRQFYRRTPWKDNLAYREPVGGSRSHPDSSNAAIALFDKRAEMFETASRAATWGTGRRASMTEAESVQDDSKTRHMSLSGISGRGASVMQDVRTRARNILHRTNSRSSKKTSPTEEAKESQIPDTQSHNTTAEASKPALRRPSFGRHRSPSATSSAFLGITGALTAVGASTSNAVLEPESQTSPFLKALKRVRSKSDITKSPKGFPGRIQTTRQQEFLTTPTLASPEQDRDLTVPTSTSSDSHVDEDEIGIRMSLPVRPIHVNIKPDLIGFKTHARELNPRLDAFLMERIGQDQVRRYKRLIKNKVDHERALESDRGCSSGDRCIAKGGQALVGSTPAQKMPAKTGPRFKVSNADDSDIDESTFDGIVTPALFPDGIPLPPTKRLPAEFECPLCFQVKHFQKPSDWTKHVHEDVQPFSCTFPKCTEPKSFKRKADWVRHENERHRHLECWKCNINECPHMCYRKDNFVQHLVREHKMKEPKIKNRGTQNGKTKSKTSANQVSSEDQEFWRLVDECRHLSPLQPREEPCKFCGNICTTWKKLSVHVGKHMEQIAMPVLDLIANVPVTKDTVISPIEPIPTRSYPQYTPDGSRPTDYGTLSPYTVSATSTYHGSSAGHSPATLQARPQRLSVTIDQQSNFYPVDMGIGSIHTTPVVASPYEHRATSLMPHNTVGNFPGSEFASYAGHQASYPPPSSSPHQGVHYHRQSIPRSGPVDDFYVGTLGQNTTSFYTPQEHFYDDNEVGPHYVDQYQNQIYQTNPMMDTRNMPQVTHGGEGIASTQTMDGGYVYSTQHPGHHPSQGYYS